MSSKLFFLPRINLITQALKRFIVAILVHALVGLRPLLGQANCRFQVGCTDFAVYQLRNKPFISAVRAICARLFFCAPWF